jgi:Uma2 family endonuclease
MVRSMTVATGDLPAVGAERRLLVEGVPWAAYVGFRDALDERAAVRMTYFDGRLELMSPSAQHEELGRMIARLVDAWAETNDVDLRGFRSTTFREEAERRGAEPDECYSLGPLQRVPDLAIEVIVTQPLLDKLTVYRGLAVPEVWVWEDGKLTVHVLGPAGYTVQTTSKLLPALDLALLSRFVVCGENQVRTVLAYRKALAGS